MSEKSPIEQYLVNPLVDLSQYINYQTNFPETSNPKEKDSKLNQFNNDEYIYRIITTFLIKAIGYNCKFDQNTISLSFIIFQQFIINYDWNLKGDDINNLNLWFKFGLTSLYEISKFNNIMNNPSLILCVYQSVRKLPFFQNALYKYGNDNDDELEKFSFLQKPFLITQLDINAIPKSVDPDLLNSLYYFELELLSSISFDLNINLPYLFLVYYLRSLDISSETIKPQQINGKSISFIQYANNLITDSLQFSFIGILHNPNVIASASIFLTLRQFKISISNNNLNNNDGENLKDIDLNDSKWWIVFDVYTEDLGHAMIQMLQAQITGKKVYKMITEEDT